MIMTGRDWYDDSEYHNAVDRAERATRIGWAAIAGTTGVLGCVLIAMAIICVTAFVACVYVVMAMDS